MPALPSHPPRLTVAYRLAQPDDLDALQQLYAAHAPRRQFERQFNRWLAWQATNRCFPLVALVDGSIIGGGQLVCTPHLTEIAELAVLPAWQGQGIGTKLIGKLLDIARQQGRNEVEMGVEKSNRRAIALYQRLGFVPVRQIVIPGSQETAILLRRNIE